MSDLDVSLRLRLLNQLSRPAEEAQRDLKELQAAAERLGRARGGDQLGGQLEKIGRNANEAKSRVAAVGSEADQLRDKLGKLTGARGGLDGLKQDANAAKQALSSAGEEAGQLKRKLGDVAGAAAEARGKIELLDDTTALSNLRKEAERTEDALRRVGSSVPSIQGGLGQSDPWRRNPPARPPVQDPRHGRLGQGLEGFADRSGLDGVVPFATSTGYMVGAAIGGSALGVAQAYRNFAGDDRDVNYIMSNMGIADEDREATKSRLRDAARDTRMPYQKIVGGYAALGASGLNGEESERLLPLVGRTALAMKADPADVAATIHDLRTKMGIADNDLPLALDMLMGGGQQGRFEGPDMAAFGPVVMPFAKNAGYTGVEGWSKLLAMLQTIREGAPSSGAAADYAADLLFKYNAPETKAKLADAGVDWDAERAAGKERNEDALTTFAKAIEKATGGDQERINEFLGDKQVYQAYLALLNGAAEMEKDKAAIDSSQGFVNQEFERFSSDPQAKLDNLANSADRAGVSLGALADRYGAGGLVDATANALDKASTDPVKTGTLMLGNGFLAQTLIEWLGIRPRNPQAPSQAEEGHVVPTGDWRASPYEVPRTKGGVSDARPMPMGDVKPSLTKDLSGAAESSMGSYNKALAAEGQKAVGIAEGIANSIRSMLNFSAAPTIQPTLLAPTSGAGNGGAPRGAGGRQTASLGPGKVSVTQNISSPNSKQAARRAVREQNREIRQANARALHDLGSLA